MSVHSIVTQLQRVKSPLAQRRRFAGSLFLVNMCVMGTIVGRAAEAASTAQLTSRMKTRWGVALPPEAGVVERFARIELKKYVKTMSGATLGDCDRLGQTPSILLGQRKHVDHVLALPPAASGHDGYTMVISDQSIVIAGENARGVVYGVYDLLERLGCRWFYPLQDPEDPEIVPRRETVAVETGTHSVAAPLKYRICNGSAWFFRYMDLAAAAKQLDWAMKNRYNGIGWQCDNRKPLVAQYEAMRAAGLLDELDRRGMVLHGPGHAFDCFLPDKDYKDAHPDWFGMRDGKRVGQHHPSGAQFCWSNPAARKQFLDNVESFVRACPHIRILCIAPFDGGPCCACARCKKAGSSTLLMTLMGEVIERLKHGAPHVAVETLGGYPPMVTPPSGVDIDPRQRIIWAHWARYHGFGYDDPRYDRKANLQMWRRAAPGGLTVCQYYCDTFCQPWIVPPFALAMQGDRRYFLDSGIDSTYVLMWWPGCWWNHGLNGYLAGRCLYDVSIDPFELIHDYALHYFGKEAGPLLAAYYDQWARHIDLAYHVRNGSTEVDRAMLATQRARWVSPAVAAVKDNAILARRVGKVQTLHTVAERLTEVHRLHHETRRLREAGNSQEAADVLATARSFTDEVLAFLRRTADLEQGLIDRRDVDAFIKLGVKGWIDKEAERIATPLILQSKYATWRSSLPKDYPQLHDFRRVLLRWINGAESHWGTDPERPGLGTCRLGDLRHTHVRTARSLPVYAALAADSELQDPVWTHEKLTERLNAASAFLCDTYDSQGPRSGFWGKKPQRNSLRYETWIIGNMLDVLQIAPQSLTPENKRRIREILIDIIEDERTSGRARELTDYRHEGITWTINLLARAAILYPDHPQASHWLDLAKHGYASSLSVKADVTDTTVVDGKPIKDWVARRCPVFHPDFTFTHHALGIHPGYMGFASHRMVSLYDMLKRSGAPVSPIWYMHYRDVTNVIKDLSLWDGRVAYPNAKDWADYLYGASSFRFHMAGLQMMFGDPEARVLEQGLFRHLQWLQLERRRGDFGPSDAEYILNVNDAKNIAFAYWLHQAHGFAPARTRADRGHARGKVFYSPYSKFVFVRDPSRFASWGWQARRNRATGRQRSTGLILPRGYDLGDHLAQWDDNLAPDYWTADRHGKRQHLHIGTKRNQVETFSGGFAVSERTELLRAGADSKRGSAAVLVDHRVMAALPDGRTVIFFASARTVQDVPRLCTADVNWRFVRSIFSDMQRMVYHKGGRTACRYVSALSTPWLNVDEIISLIPIGTSARVTCELFGAVDEHGVPVAEKDPFGTHAGQTVRLSVCSLQPRDYERGTTIFTACVAFVTDTDAAEAVQLSRTCRTLKVGHPARAWQIRGRDGESYAVVANASDSETDARLSGWSGGRLLTPETTTATMEAPNTMRLHLEPRGCAVVVLSHPNRTRR